MTVAGLAALALGFATLTAIARRWTQGPWLAGLAGFAVVLIGSWSLPLGLRAQLGGDLLESTGYLRLVLMLLSAAGLTLTFVGSAVGGNRAVPALALLWFGITATALAIASPIPAVLLLTTGSLAAVLIAVDAASPERAMVATRGLRAMVIAGFLASLAVTWAGLATAGLQAGLADGGPPTEGGAVGLAFLAAAMAVALRAGAIPVHAWSSRLAEQLPMLALPVTFAWGPAALAIVVLGWADTGITGLGEPMTAERAAIGAIAVASMIFGSLAAYLHDDLEHVVSYSLVTDSGVVLLALAAADPAAWGPARTWIVAYVVAKSALAAWATTVRSSFGTSRIPELSGWARRSPVLAGALVLIGLTAVGLPGLTAFEARARLIDLALDWPFDVIAGVGALASVGYYARLLYVGFRAPSSGVALALGIRPSWPGGRPARLWPDLVRQLPAAWNANRALAAGSAVLLLACLGLAVAAGSLHVPGAAAAPGPGAGVVEETPSPSPVLSSPAPSGTLPSPGAGHSTVPVSSPQGTPIGGQATGEASPAPAGSSSPAASGAIDLPAASSSPGR